MQEKQSPGHDWHRAEARKQNPIYERTGAVLVPRKSHIAEARVDKRARAGAHAEGEIESVPALIEPGDYLVKFSHWSTHLLFKKTGKLAVHFTICDHGDYFGTALQRWYNVRVRGRIGRNGHFTATWGSDCLREYACLVGMTRRNDRIALSKYAPLLLVARIRTVESNRTQAKLPMVLQYSVIGQLLRVEAGRNDA